MKKKTILLIVTTVLVLIIGVFTLDAKAKAKYSKSTCKAYAHELVINKYKWSENDYKALVKLWNRESGWNTLAKSKNGCYGIPQAKPGKKMKSEGKDYKTNCKTQIRWGLKYIKRRYKTPTRAWKHFQKKRWY